MRAYSNISRYNIPVFEIAPHVTASKTYHEIVLNYCDILPIMRNVTFNNNRLQWLRIVDTNNNPFFTDPPAIEVHLCSLYITPGYYATLDALVSQINKDIAKAATVIATDKELLNDPYLAALGTDDVFSIVDEQLHFNVCDILPVASNVDELADSITDKCIATDKSKLLHIKNIMNADGTLSNNKYVVLKYNTNEKALDNTLYQYKQIANGLYKQIGIAAAEIEKQSHPYLLKTFNYCEQIYDGTIKMKTAMKLKTIDTTIPADAVMSSSAASYAFLQREIMSNTLYSISSYTPRIPTHLYFYETINPDIETTINRSSEYNEIYSFSSISNQLRFSSEARLTVPDDGKLYIYIANPELPYALANGNYCLSYEFIN